MNNMILKLLFTFTIGYICSSLLFGFIGAFAVKDFYVIWDVLFKTSLILDTGIRDGLTGVSIFIGVICAVTRFITLKYFNPEDHVRHRVNYCMDNFQDWDWIIQTKIVMEGQLKFKIKDSLLKDIMLTYIKEYFYFYYFTYLSNNPSLEDIKEVYETLVEIKKEINERTE